jgi:hypothetical protein
LDQEIDVTKDKCISIDNYSITKGGELTQAVNIDCPENYEYSIVVSNSCNKWFQKYGCSYSIKIRLNSGGPIIHQTIINGGTSVHFSGNFSEIPGIENLGYPNTHNLVVEIIKSCTINTYPPQSTSTITSFNIPFDVVSTIGGSVYTTSEWDYTAIELGEIICDVTGKVICCNPNATFLIRSDVIFSHEFIETSSIGFTWNSKLSFGASNGIIGASNELVGSASIKKETKELLKDALTWRIDESIKGKEGVCVFPGVQVIKQGIIEKTYQANCDGPDILIESNIIYVPTQLNVTDECTVQPSNDCEPLTPPIINKGNEFHLAESSDKSLTTDPECDGYIMLDFGMSNIDGYSIGWTGPNGFESSEFDLENLELGVYYYTITNSCCEMVEGQVDLCPNMEEGPWLLQADMVTFCKEISCSIDDVSLKSSESSCASSSSDICVTADNTDEYFNGTNCVTDHFYQGEFLGQTISQSSTEEISLANQLCTKITYCDGVEVNNQTQFPFYGPWSFNIINEKCERSVICFNKTMDENEVKEPEIVETYDNNTGLCNRTAFCEGIPNTLPPVSPSNPGFWTYTSWGGCTKTINCSFDSPPLNVNGTPGFSNWSWNEFSSQCVANSVTCDNFIVGGATHNQNPNGYGSWNWSNSGPNGFTCYRDVYCGTTNSIVTDYGMASWNTTSIPCPSNPSWNLAYLVCNGVQTNVTDCVLPLKDDEELDLRSSYEDIVISPNPFVDYINISGLENLEDLAIEIYNSKGIMVLETENKKQINLVEFPEGIYILRVQVDSKIIINERIVKIN